MSSKEYYDYKKKVNDAIASGNKKLAESLIYSKATQNINQIQADQLINHVKEINLMTNPIKLIINLAEIKKQQKESDKFFAEIMKVNDSILAGKKV